MSKKGGGGGGGVRFKTSLHNTVYDVMQHRPGWQETESELDWDIFWADTGWMHEVFDHVRLADDQRVNHFRNHYELTRKDLLVKNLKRARKALEREERHVEADKYEFYPQTYVLPVEYGLFVEEFKRAGGTWIMKPIGKAQGRGIFLFNKLNQVADWRRTAAGIQAESYVAQRYLDNPCLVGGKKFDLRIYVCVTSYSPLTAYLYRSGFARFSNSRYSMAKDDISNNLIHLTNVAIQKADKNYDQRSGMKMGIRELKLHLTSVYGPESVSELFYEIQMVILRSLFSVQNVIINDKHCFELYGYDVIIDESLQPWLLEVNASPSLTSDTDLDYELKCAMLNDVLDVVDMEGRRGGGPMPESVGGFDLIWDNGPVATGEGGELATQLGYYNENITQGKAPPLQPPPPRPPPELRPKGNA